MNLMITGPPRTGTTGMFYLLNLSPKVFVFNESCIFENHRWNTEHSTNSLLKKLTHLFGESEDTNRHFLSGKTNLNSLINQVRTERFRGIDIVSLLSDQFEVVGDKFPGYIKHFYDNRHPEGVSSDVLQKVKVIFTVRDGRDCIASRYRNRGKVGWGRDTIKEAEESWLKSMRNLDHAFHSYSYENSLLLKYENSVLDLKLAILAIEGFLDKDLMINQDLAAEKYRPTNIGAWRKEIPNYSFSQETQKYLYKFGYQC